MDLLENINKMRNMMGLELLSEVEVSIDYLYDKKYNDIPREIFDKVLDADPKYNGKQPSNYSQWMINLIRKNELKSEDIYKVKQYLPYLIKYKNKLDKKDINQIKSLPDLFLTVKQFIEKPDEHKSNTQISKEIKKDAKKVYEDDEWMVIIPETKEASCYYGKGTQWCTAASDNDYEDNQFDYYNKFGPLFININKKSGNKYQMNFPDSDSSETINIMDVNDKAVEGNVRRKINMTDGLVKFYEDKVGWVVRIIFEDFYEGMSFPETNYNGFYEFGDFQYTPDNGEMLDYYNLGRDYTIENGKLCFDGQPFAVCPIKYNSPKELADKDIRLVDRGEEYTMLNFEGGNDFVIQNESGQKVDRIEIIEYSNTDKVFKRGSDFVNLDNETIFSLTGKWEKLPHGSVRAIHRMLGGRYFMLTLRGNDKKIFNSETGEETVLKELGSNHYAINGYIVYRFDGENVAKLPDSWDGEVDKFVINNKKYYVLNGKSYNKEGEEVSREELLANR